MAVSVIIAAYDAAGTIEAAVASIRAQTRLPAEVIVVDDGSSDGTADLVRRFDCGVPLRLIAQPNAGPAAARNRGAAEASGEWIAFLDADDAWAPCRLETQLRAAALHPDVALWCSATANLDEPADEDRGSPGAASRCDAPAELAFRRLSVPEFARHNPVATSTVLVRRSAFGAAGGFDAQFRGPEDYDLWMRILAAGVGGARLDASLAFYRNRPGSLSMDDRRFLPQVLRVLDKAFAAGGALSAWPGLRRRARANQFWNASWMAFHRGARGRALALLARALALDPRVGGRLWAPLVWRYLVGRPGEGLGSQRGASL